MKKISHIGTIAIFALAAMGFFLLASHALAVGLPNPLGAKSIPELIGRIILGVTGVVGSIALAMFLYGGFLWLTAAGKDDQVSKGKDTLVWAALGLALIFASYSLVNFIFGALTGPK